MRQARGGGCNGNCGRGNYENNYGKGRGHFVSDNSSTASAIINGVDITNLTRRFTNQEMQQLGNNRRRLIYQQCKRMNEGRGCGRGQGRQQGHGRGRGGRSINAIIQEQQDEVSQISEQTTAQE